MLSFLKSLTLITIAGVVLGNPVEEIFGRAVDNSCKAPLGSGTCKHTKDCLGVSYPTGLCPKDPDDVQVSGESRRGLASRTLAHCLISAAT